ncbi:Sec-independent protein translocase protein TatB [Paracoccus aminophilus]|uniref:Sec-independent protein translocase protein TatB n=1 Tax=Paracoccus aminophilus JCM 7686 TaxID=1367847 RepID=S5XKV6_PARAH|nr:Sec-independent protein translocase protein TatB [Paracoccus aminophilus]AGT07849.1 twin-arginine translocation protein, TatB subunit [Paracoccus aminophilus JCM 7686]
MFDVGWSELLLIGVVALIVIGPEDLPKLFRTLGRISARARGMAREFSSAMEDAAKSSGLDEAAKTLKDVNSLTSKRALGLDALDRAADKFEKWDPLTPKDEAARGSLVPDPSSPQPPSSSSSSQPTQSSALPAPPSVAAATPAPAFAPEDITPPAQDAPSRRRLHAVRRADLDGTTEKKGD